MTDLGPLVPRNRELHPEPYWPDYKTSIARSPRLPLLSMESSASEETGPTFGHGLIGALDNNLILNWSQGKAAAIGERILVHGHVLDEFARPAQRRTHGRTEALRQADGNGVKDLAVVAGLLAVGNQGIEEARSVEMIAKVVVPGESAELAKCV